MPELPEVETTRRGIAPWLEGAVIAALEVRQPALRWPIPADLPSRVQGCQIGLLVRRSKYLILPLQNQAASAQAPLALLCHLGMSGSLRLVDSQAPWKKHDHYQLTLKSEVADNPPRALRYHDPRRFGALLACDESLEHHPLLCRLGPEPLDDAFDAAYLYQITRKSSRAIKTLIMDAHAVVGVGNIYASEALFLAGIDPRKAAKRLSRPACVRLVDQIKQVLQAAIEQGGTTLKDFVGGDGKPGYFVQQLRVYGREGQPCLVCQTPLRKVVLGQRATCFCPLCQR